MLNFLKNALVRGLIVLIPVVILFVTIRELMGLMVGLATPIADLFPEDTFSNENETEIIAILLILGTALILGAISLIKPARSAAAWVEDRTLNAFPMYRMLKSLMAAMLNVEDGKSFKPAFFHSDERVKEPVYVVEEEDDGSAVVMFPWSPTAFAGSVKIVSVEHLEYVDVTLDEFSVSITNFGQGVSDIIKRQKQP